VNSITRDKLIESLQDVCTNAKRVQFVLELLGNGFNVARAAEAIGYTMPWASTLMAMPETRRAIRIALDQHAVRADAIIKGMMEVALDMDLADFQDVVDGRETLPQARARGVNTKFVRKIRPVVNKDGLHGYAIELEDRQRCRELLVELAAREQTLAQAQSEEIAQYERPSVTYRRIVIEEMSKPPAPGLPVMQPPDTWAEESLPDGSD